MSWNVLAQSFATQVPTCGYQFTGNIVQSTVPSFLTSVSGQNVQFSVYTRLRSAASTYNINVSFTIIGYTYSVVPSQISIQKLIVIDPCLMTQITGPIQIQNFIEFVGYNQESKQTYSFNDTVSQEKTQNSDSDYCGNKTLKFQINNTETNQLTGENSSKIKFTLPQNLAPYGMLPASVLVCMQEYQAICSSFDFNVSAIDIQAPYQQNLNYSVGSPAEKFSLESYQILPKTQNFAELVNRTFQAYLKTSGTILQTPFDLTSQNLFQIRSQSWISFDSASKLFTVQTQNNSQVGIYAIVVLEIYSDPADRQFFYEFNLTVTKSIFQKLVPYFSPNLGSQAVNWCVGSSKNTQWKFTIPKPISPYGFAVTISVQMSTEFFSYDSSSTTITQNQLAVSPGRQTISVLLVDIFNLQSQNDFQVNFQCTNNQSLSQQIMKSQVDSQLSNQAKLNLMFGNMTLKIKKSGLGELEGFQPAQITSINQYGQVNVTFFHDVFLPNFNQSQNNQIQQRNLQIGLPKTQQQFLDDKSLSVQQITGKGRNNLNWTCVSLTKRDFMLQIDFNDPLEVSASTTDVLSITFLLPELFILTTMTDYLFTNASQQVISRNLPQQFPSKQSQQQFQKAADAASKLSTAVLIGTVALQVVAKKAMSSMFDFYITLQILLLFGLKSRNQNPASLELLLNTIDGIVNLSSFNKQDILETLQLPTNLLANGSLLSNLGGIAIMFVFLLILIALVLIIRKMKTNQKVKSVVNKIKAVLFWNFLIRYFQVAFINFNYSASVSVVTTASLVEKITSSGILVVVYSLVLLVCYILLQRPLIDLDRPINRATIGNLYTNLDCESRLSIFYGALFFLERIIIVLVIAISTSFSIQWIIVFLVIVLKMAYMLAFQPYRNLRSAIGDYINTGNKFLIVSLFVSISAYIQNSQDRFQNGILVDGIFVVAFGSNVVLVIYTSATQIILKLKRIHFQWKVRLEAQKKLKEHQELELMKQEEIRKQEQFQLVYNKIQLGLQNRDQYWLRYISSLDQQVPQIQQPVRTPFIHNQVTQQGQTTQMTALYQLNLLKQQFEIDKGKISQQIQSNYTIQESKTDIELVPQNFSTQSQVSQADKLFQKYSMEDPISIQANLKVREQFNQLGKESQQNKPTQRKLLQNSVLEPIEEEKQPNSLKGDDSFNEDFNHENNQIIQEHQQYVKTAIKAEYRRHIRERKKQQKTSSVELQDENQDQKECRYFVWRQKLPPEVKQAIPQAQLRQDWFDYDYEKNQKRKTTHMGHKK